MKQASELEVAWAILRGLRPPLFHAQRDKVKGRERENVSSTFLRRTRTHNSDPLKTAEASMK